MAKRLTPKQKRSIREKIEKKEKEIKKARLLERPEFRKHARSLYEPTAGKYPKAQKNPDSIMHYNMQWCDDNADLEGKWSWGETRQWSNEEWNNRILYNLNELSKLPWSEIYAQRTGGKERHKKHHDMSVELICDEAFKRWLDIGLEEYDTAFRFRFSNKQRLWGYRVFKVFNIVWWDPNHMIYPTEPV